MDWQTILKQPELRTGSNVTTTLGSDSNEDEEGPCFKKLKEYQEKIMGKTHILDKDIRMYTAYTLNDMPEEVACAALKHLNDSRFFVYDPQPRFSPYDEITVVVDGEDWLIDSFWKLDRDGGFLPGVVSFNTLNNEISMGLIIKHRGKVNARFRISYVAKDPVFFNNESLIDKYYNEANWRDN